MKKINLMALYLMAGQTQVAWLVFAAFELSQRWGWQHRSHWDLIWGWQIHWAMLA